MTKRINKILWNGTEVPQAATRADGLDGLNLGELFIKNDPQEPGLYTRTTDGNVVLLGGGGGSGTSEFVDWNSIVNKPTKVSYFINDANYATTSDLDNRIDALVNGAPQAYDTLKEIADVLAGNVDSIADILDALGTKVSKTDFNTAIANVNNSISALNTELSGKIDLKLDAVTFNELFEKVQLEDGTWAIKAKLGLFSDGFISAKGSNVGGTSSEGGAVALYQLNDVLADGTGVSGAQHGAVFVYDATIGKWKGIAQSEIVPNLTGYAKESWVLSQGFLTQHQDLSDYAKLTDIPTIPTTDINKGVTAYGWGNHATMGYITASASITGNAASASLIKPTTGTGVASSWVSLTSYTKVWGEAFNISSLGSDTGDIALYLRSGVYTKNSAELCVAIDGDFYAQTGSKKVLHEGNYTDYAYSKTTIDSKFSGLGTFAYKSSLAFADLTGKPTTLNGYGITDTYTKAQVDSALGGYLPLSGGTITSASGDLFCINRTSGNPQIRFEANGGLLGYIGFTSGNAVVRLDSTYYNIIHSGNIGSQSVLSAEKLVDASGAELVSSSDKTLYVGGGTYTSRDTHILGSGVRLRYGASAAVGLLLNSSGNVLIGTTTDSGYKLHVKSATTALMCESTASESSIYFSASSENAYRWAIGKGVWNIGGDFGIGEYNTAKKLFFRIAKDGNVGIGLSYATAPSYKLHINGTLHASDAATFGSTLEVASKITLSGTTASTANIAFSRSSYNYITFPTDGSLCLSTAISTSGIVLRVTSTAIEPMTTATKSVGTSSKRWGAIYGVDGDFSGTLHATTGIYSDGYVSAKGQNTSSDMRLKNVLNEVVLGVKDIANAPSVRFSWKNGGGVDVGSSAQYWQGLLPDAVKERDGMLEMQYANIALLSAIALAKNFETMDERVARLERENEELRNEINSLRYGA